MPDPLVSVIINCYNGEKYIQAAIDSVYAQSYDNWEIVLWDNCSTDKTPEIARLYDSKLRYHRADQTLPLGAARNLALKRASGTYIAFLDCDDVWLPDKLSRQVKLLEGDPGLGLVYCGCCNSVAGVETKSTEFARHKPSRGMVFGELLVYYPMAMSSVVLRHSALASLGEWFDNRFHLVEEKDLFLRIARHFRLDYIDEGLVIWRISKGSSSYKKFELFAHENELILEKMRSLYPEIDEEFPREVEALHKKIRFQKAVALWRDGNGADARAHLRPFLSERKFRFLYYVTFLPKQLFWTVYSTYLLYVSRRSAGFA